MCGSLCLVIRTVNDRDAWGDRERAGGERGPLVWVGAEGPSWRFEPHQGFTAATIACVVIVLKAWRPRPEPLPPAHCCA